MYKHKELDERSAHGLILLIVIILAMMATLVTFFAIGISYGILAYIESPVWFRYALLMWLWFTVTKGMNFWFTRYMSRRMRG